MMFGCFVFVFGELLWDVGVGSGLIGIEWMCVYLFC